MIPRRKIHIVRGEFSLAFKAFFNKTKHFYHCITKWEEAFADYIGVRHAIAVSSGRKGMSLILKSLNLNPGDEVIIPAYTLKDLLGIIQRMGLVPVLADIDPHTFNIDSKSVERRITARTKVIIATHLFGTPCQIEELVTIGRVRSIYIIEDCAHAIGSEFKGKKAGSFGHASFFSLETIKPINTYGGGMVVTNDERLARCVRTMINGLGTKNKIPLKRLFFVFLENLLLPTPLSFPLLYLLASPRWNKKIYNVYRRTQKVSTSNDYFTEFQAYIGLKKLETLEKRISQRHKLADLLKSSLPPSIEPQLINEGIVPNYYFFVVQSPLNTKETRKFLLMHGIDTGIEAEIADDCGAFLGREDCPATTKIFRRTIHLPLYEDLSPSRIRYIGAVLGELLQ